MMNAEREAKIESYGRAHEILTNALTNFPHEMWRFKPAADEWSIHEIIIHISRQ